MQTNSAILPPDAPPDWAAIDREILCPLCDYNLRGLTEPRCPECGHQFEWQKVLVAGDNRHPYLFEHHPRRNIGSFLRTLRGSLLPRRFWKALLPIHRPVVGRLLVYSLIVSLLGVVSLLPSLVVPVVDSYSQLAYQRARIEQIIAHPGNAKYIKDNFGDAQTYRDRSGYWGPQPPFLWTARRAIQDQRFLSRAVVPTLVAWLTWPWLTFASLLVFRSTMRQAKIHLGHVLRCCIYSADVGVFLGVVLLLISPLTQGGYSPRVLLRELTSWAQVLDPVAVLAFEILMLALLYRLWVAYRKYLAFPHALATVIASQVIVWLILLKAWYVWHYSHPW